MPTIYKTREGDVLDAICSQHYGVEKLNQSLAAVLEANYGLAALGDIYPAGVDIILPDWAPAPVASPVQLWA